MVNKLSKGPALVIRTLLVVVTYLSCSGCENEKENFLTIAKETPGLNFHDSVHGFDVSSIKVSSREGMAALNQVSKGIGSPTILYLTRIELGSKDVTLLSRFRVFKLGMIQCSFETGALAQLSKMRDLETLQIIECSIDDEVMRSLELPASLVSFSVSRADGFSGECIFNWERHTQLKDLGILRTGMADKGIEAISETFPNLEACSIKYIDGVRATPEGCMKLANLPKLQPPVFEGPAWSSFEKRVKFAALYNARYREIHGDNGVTPFIIPK